MEISLIRHGRSTFIENKKISCKEFAHWVKQYDSNGVSEGESYPLETIKMIQRANIVLTSNLKRSIDSANILNSNVNVVSKSLFREVEIPTVSIKLFGIKLYPNVWTIILRCLWLSGYSKECESYKNPKKRAEEASQVLVEYAKRHQSVTLVGHGFFNRLLGKELQRMGWSSKKKISSKHWHCTTYLFANCLEES